MKIQENHKSRVFAFEEIFSAVFSLKFVFLQKDNLSELSGRNHKESSKRNQNSGKTDNSAFPW